MDNYFNRHIYDERQHYSFFTNMNIEENNTSTGAMTFIEAKALQTGKIVAFFLRKRRKPLKKI